MDEIFLGKLYLSQQTWPRSPSPDEISDFFLQVLGTLFSDFARESFPSMQSFQEHVIGLQNKLEEMVVSHVEEKGASNVARQFFDDLPVVHQRLEHDAVAMFQGDPAATSLREVVRTYPGFYAIAAYRLAHSLHRLGVTDIPRVITEHAHSKTGIDIHPAAIIGEHFCIDHGTGVVIGETTSIGNHVKIYQGVTLGALSVDKADAKKKRHPTIEDNVIIYAGATILGGETSVGHDTIIGGNVWLTRSVPPFSKIYYTAKMENGETEETHFLFKSMK